MFLHAFQYTTTVPLTYSPKRLRGSCYTIVERLENNFELDEIKYMYMRNDPKVDVG
jgi:hypothetical protein